MHQGKGGQEDNPWPEARRAPRPYGRGNAALATFPRPCQGGARPVHLIFWIRDLMPWADKIFSLKLMTTWQAFNHPLNGGLGSSSSFAHHGRRIKQAKLYQQNFTSNKYENVMKIMKNQRLIIPPHLSFCSSRAKQKIRKLLHHFRR